MGLLTNDPDEIREIIKNTFGNADNYLIALKYNDMKTGLAKLIISNLFYTLDSNRTFLLFFDEQGIREKEISNSVKGDFLLMPWHEIENIKVTEKNKKVMLEFDHLGKRVGYEIPFTGKLFKDNQASFDHLKAKQWHRV